MKSYSKLGRKGKDVIRFFEAFKKRRDPIECLRLLIDLSLQSEILRTVRNLKC